MVSIRSTPIRRRASGWLAALLLGLPVVAAAQSEDQFIRIYEMILKPEAATQWHRMQREEAIPALLEGGYPWVDVWRSGGTGNAYYRSILVPITDPTELDDLAVFTRALGAEKAEELLERHRGLVTSIETTIVRTRPDLGFGTPPSDPSIGILTTVTVENGRTEEFEQRLRSHVARELQLSGVASFRVGQVLFGGDANRYFTLVDFEENEERRAGPGHPTAFEWAFGPVGVAGIAEQPGSPIVAIEREILRYDETLSARPRSE